jgi:hypothetical protein
MNYCQNSNRKGIGAFLRWWESSLNTQDWVGWEAESLSYFLLVKPKLESTTFGKGWSWGLVFWGRPDWAYLFKGKKFSPVLFQKEGAKPLLFLH